MRKYAKQTKIRGTLRVGKITKTPTIVGIVEMAANPIAVLFPRLQKRI